jgi:hypothetical protein
MKGRDANYHDNVRIISRPANAYNPEAFGAHILAEEAYLDAIEFLRADDPGTQCKQGCCGSPSVHEEAIDVLTEHVSEAKDGVWW